MVSAGAERPGFVPGTAKDALHRDYADGNVKQGVPDGVMTRMLVPALPGGDMRAKTGRAFRGACRKVGTGATRALGRAPTLGARSGTLGRAQMAAPERARMAPLEAVPLAVPPAFDPEGRLLSIE